MYGRSEGNPLFTEELLAAGVDGRAALPPSLREALLLRVERLPAETQRLLRLLAVGGRADDALLADGGGRRAGRALGVDPRGDRGPDRGRRRGGRYGFRHALLREVIYDDLLPGERSELHLACAHALERAPPTATRAWNATGIAHHYYSAGDQPQALASALTAARAVQRLHAYGEAAGLLDRALELWNRVADPEQLAGADHAEVLTRAGRAHYLAGDEEMGAALYETAVEEIDEDADPERAAQVLTALATCQWSLGLADRSRATQRRGLELLPPGEDSPARAALLAQRVRFLLLQGRFRDVRDEAPEALEAAERAGLGRDLGVVNRLGCALFALGDEQGARARLDESIELALAAGTSDDIATAYLNYADALHLAGQSREGREVAERGLAEVEQAARAPAAEPLDALDPAQPRPRSSSTSATGRPPTSSCARPAPSTAGWRSPTPTCAERSWRSAAASTMPAREVLDHADELLANALEPQYIALLAALRAELERRGGDLERATAEVDRGIDRIQFCSDDAARLALVAAAGASIAADAAERARDLGEAEAEAAAVARAESLLELIRAAAEDGPRPVEARPARDRRSASSPARAAPTTRRSGPRRPRAWERLERPYDRAIARWRQAQAELASGRPRRRRDLARRRDRGRRRARRALAGGGGEGVRRPRAAQPAHGGRRADGDGSEPASREPFGLTPRERQVLAPARPRRHQPGDRRAALHGREDRQRARLADPDKLDVRSRTEAAAVAHRHGLASDRTPTVAEPAAEPSRSGGAAQRWLGAARRATRARAPRRRSPPRRVRAPRRGGSPSP